MPYSIGMCNIWIKKAILMGRGGAYPGIYDTGVTGYWGDTLGVLEYSERTKNYLELNWKTGVVIKH